MIRLHRVGILVAILACGTAWATPAMAQAPSPGDVESNPIRCWWGIDKPAVHIGEQFTLKLTCAVAETNRVTAAPVVNQFEATAVQVAPFEVLSGTHHEDLQSPPWRYFQSEYILRLVGDKYFGQDVDIPSIKITYNLQFANNAGSQGRDLMYVLPPIPVRIMSLVPKLTADIREAPAATFGDIEARQFRSTSELIAAAISFGFAILLVGFALVKTAGRYRRRVPAAARPLPARVVLSGCLQALNRVKGEAARSGWTPALTGQALTAFRIAGAVALGRPVAQTIVDRTVPERVGQIVVPRGTFARKRTLVSASTTTNLIDLQLANGDSGGPSAHRDATLEQIRESLRAFSDARYGRNGHLNTAALETALVNGISVVRGLRVKKLWPAPAGRPLTKSAASL